MCRPCGMCASTLTLKLSAESFEGWRAVHALGLRGCMLQTGLVGEAVSQHAPFLLLHAWHA